MTFPQIVHTSHESVRSIQKSANSSDYDRSTWETLELGGCGDSQGTAESTSREEDPIIFRCKVRSQWLVSHGRLDGLYRVLFCSRRHDGLGLDVD